MPARIFLADIGASDNNGVVPVLFARVSLCDGWNTGRTLSDWHLASAKRNQLSGAGRGKKAVGGAVGGGGGRKPEGQTQVRAPVMIRSFIETCRPTNRPTVARLCSASSSCCPVVAGHWTPPPISSSPTATSETNYSNTVDPPSRRYRVSPTWTRLRAAGTGFFLPALHVFSGLYWIFLGD